jgi:uncharacterized protein (DUF2141 family)
MSTLRFALVLSLTLAAVPGAAQTTRARLVVEITSLRNDGGTVGCLLFASRTGFPTEPSRAIARTGSVPSGRRAQCVFDDLAPGTYAVAVHHDEDGDGVFDTGIFGIPLEGIGASRDARGNMGPPSWDDARLDVPAGETEITIHVGYPF